MMRRDWFGPREIRILNAALAIALDWSARWRHRDRMCWACGSRALDVRAIDVREAVATCRDCTMTFGPLR